MNSDYLTARRWFEMDGSQDNAEALGNALVEERKAALEEEARQELYGKLGNTLADFQTRPTWTVADAEDAGRRVYSLTMKVVFKP